MVNEAESHAAEDKAKREKVDARNQLDSVVYQVEKTLKDNEAKFSTEDKQGIETALQETRQAIEGGDIEAMRAATDRLEKASHRLAEVIYKSNAGASTPGDHAGAEASGPQPGPGADDVIDAEVVDSREGGKG